MSRRTSRGLSILIDNIILCLIITSKICASYEIPEVSVEAFKRGFRVSIPDEEGVQAFAINANINDPIRTFEQGIILGQVVSPTGHEWVYENTELSLELGDVLNYWIYIQVDDQGFVKDGYTFEVTRLLPEELEEEVSDDEDDYDGGSGEDPFWCTPSPTVVTKGYRSYTNVCANQLIFEETFDYLQPEIWQVEQKIPRDDMEFKSGHRSSTVLVQVTNDKRFAKECPFVSYQNREENVEVKDGQLIIRPSLLQNSPTYEALAIKFGVLDIFSGCTEKAELCSYKASGFNILPPVVSARINSKPSFAFKYGTIEIRARLPRGDWIYPELYLEPLKHRYGLEKYSSGLVRVAFARGNVDLRPADGSNQSIGNGLLAAGVVLDQFQCHERFINDTYTEGGEDWGYDFHVFSMEWFPDSISFSVDNRKYGGIEASTFHSSLFGCDKIKRTSTRWSKGSPLAPFDQEFYISLGVGVGGVTDFPNGAVTNLGHPKPWGNTHNKAKLTFWEDLPNWYSTWDDYSELEVDYVKVWAA